MFPESMPWENLKMFMKTYGKGGWVALMVALVATTMSGFALALPVSESADWTLKYEMNVNPNTQNLDGNLDMDWYQHDTLTFSGTMIGTVDVPGFPLIRSYDTLEPGSVWVNSANNLDYSNGWTLEASMKVTNIVDNIPGNWKGACTISASPLTGGTMQQALLSLTPDGTFWSTGGSTPKKVNTLSNADGLHVFRIAQEPGSDTLSLWRDTELLCNTLTWAATTTTHQFLYVGDITGGAGSDYEVDYVRMISGAYAPYALPTADQLPTKNSTDFTYRYECNVIPGPEDLDDNGFDDFDPAGTITPTPSGSGTVLFDASFDPVDSSYIDSGATNDTTALWTTQDFDLDVDGYTIEIRAKITAEATAGSPVLSLGASPSNEDEFALLNIGLEGTGFNSGLELDASDNSDDFHVFRIVANTRAEGGMYYIYRDGVLLTESEGICCTATTEDRNALYLGDISEGWGGAFELDYVRFMKGAFAPGGIPGDTDNDGDVDAVDAQTVAEHWGAPTTNGAQDGDFDGDGVVGPADAAILAAHWGYGTSEAASGVPEPSVLVMLLGLFSAWVVARRRP